MSAIRLSLTLARAVLFAGLAFLATTPNQAQALGSAVTPACPLERSRHPPLVGPDRRSESPKALRASHQPQGARGRSTGAAGTTAGSTTASDRQTRLNIVDSKRVGMSVPNDSCPNNVRNGTNMTQLHARQNVFPK
jgi:hypothetical protein